MFWLTLALGGGGLVVAAGGLVAAIRSIHPASGRAGRITLAGLDFSYPRLNVSEAVLLTVAAVGTLVIANAIRAGWRQRRALRVFLARLEVLGPLETHPVITVIADRRPQAFCAGFVGPKIFVSQRILDVLGDAELEAVLALGTLAALGAVIWLTIKVAAVHATLGLPLLCTRPCLVMTVLLPFATCVRIGRGRRLVRSARGAREKWSALARQTLKRPAARRVKSRDLLREVA